MERNRILVEKYLYQTQNLLIISCLPFNRNVWFNCIPVCDYILCYIIIIFFIFALYLLLLFVCMCVIVCLTEHWFWTTYQKRKIKSKCDWANKYSAHAIHTTQFSNDWEQEWELKTETAKTRCLKHLVL